MQIVSHAVEAVEARLCRELDVVRRQHAHGASLAVPSIPSLTASPTDTSDRASCTWDRISGVIDNLQSTLPAVGEAERLSTKSTVPWQHSPINSKISSGRSSFSPSMDIRSSTPLRGSGAPPPGPRCAGFGAVDKVDCSNIDSSLQPTTPSTRLSEGTSPERWTKSWAKPKGNDGRVRQLSAPSRGSKCVPREVSPGLATAKLSPKTHGSGGDETSQMSTCRSALVQRTDFDDKGSPATTVLSLEDVGTHALQRYVPPRSLSPPGRAVSPVMSRSSSQTAHGHGAGRAPQKVARSRSTATAHTPMDAQRTFGAVRMALPRAPNESGAPCSNQSKSPPVQHGAGLSTQRAGQAPMPWARSSPDLHSEQARCAPSPHCHGDA